jgi:hypothetical protein
MILNTNSVSNEKTGRLRACARPADWCHLQHVRTLMGLSRRRLSRDEALRLIDNGQIQWAWDISRLGARRSEVRIWRESLLSYLAAESGQAKKKKPEAAPLQDVIAAILPKPWALTPRAAVVGRRELQRRFLCCRTHLAGLVEDGELRVCGRGILYQSAFEFLKRRCLSL